MITPTTRSVQSRRRPLSASPVQPLLDILLAALPLLLIGFIGTKLGPGSTLGGGLINLAYIAAVAVAGIILKARGTSWQENGLARPQKWSRTIVTALATIAVYLAVSILFQLIVVSLAGAQAEIDQSRFNPVAGNVGVFLLMVLLSWTTIAFGEEMFFRAFIINRLGQLFQASRARWPLAALGSAAMFGFAHYLVEGPVGIITNGLLGLVLAAVYLRSGRNLWITIIAHALMNTLRFVLLFVGAV